MSQKSKKIIFIQIMYCIFVMCLIFITKTYSKYTSFSEGERLFETANWKVKIENIDIETDGMETYFIEKKRYYRF